MWNKNKGWKKGNGKIQMRREIKIYLFCLKHKITWSQMSNIYSSFFPFSIIYFPMVEIQTQTHTHDGDGILMAREKKEKEK